LPLQDALYVRNLLGFVVRICLCEKQCSRCILHKYKNVWLLKFWDFSCEMFWHKPLTFKPQNNYLTDKSEIQFFISRNGEKLIAVWC